MIKVKCLHPKVPYGANCYILSSGNEYAVVDPSVSYKEALKSCDVSNMSLKYIIVTHAHFDHILEIDTWAKNGAPVAISAEDAPALNDSYKNCYSIFLGVDKVYCGEVMTLFNGQKLNLGDDVMEVISAPGHTLGGIVLSANGSMISGDTIFARGYGRYDLPGGDPISLLKTIKSLIAFPDDTVVYPGHGDQETIGEIRKYLNML